MRHVTPGRAEVQLASERGPRDKENNDKAPSVALERWLAETRQDEPFHVVGLDAQPSSGELNPHL